MTFNATAIVVTHNSARHIVASLGALVEAGLDVRVVDNASCDGTTELVMRNFPALAVTANATNLGFAQAVNQALTEVAGETVLLVNPDAVVPPETVFGLLQHLAEHPTVGVAGPRLVDEQGQAAISAHPFETLSSVLASRFGGSLLPVSIRRRFSGTARRAAYDACRGSAGGTRRASSVDWLSGACLAVRTDLLRSLGGLDERYFLYYEDEELCLQARRRGADVVYLQALQAVHVGGASSELGATWPQLYRSMLVFFSRHRRSSFGAVRAAILLRALLGMGFAGVRTMLRDRTGSRRVKAWREVAEMAAASTLRSLEGPSR